MLVKLTENKKETERCIRVAKENDFEYPSQSEMMIETGIYRANFDFNFSAYAFIEKLDWHDDAIYGVADNIEQIKEYCKSYVDDLNKQYIIEVTPVFQDEDNVGKGGGWRWHKWGPYIGELNPQCEYLDDEDFGPDFKYVLCFTLYKVVKE